MLSIRGDNHDVTIYYSASNKGLKMLNLSDKSVSDIINSDMSGVYYVATFADKLFYANTNTHTVACCDLHGTTRGYSNAIVIFNINGIISRESFFFFTYLE
jgi:hypothetical protein